MKLLRLRRIITVIPNFFLKLVRNQEYAYQAMVNDLPDGAIVLVMDFAENYKHVQQFNTQAEYFSQLQTCIYVCEVRVKRQNWYYR